MQVTKFRITYASEQQEVIETEESYETLNARFPTADIQAFAEPTVEVAPVPVAPIKRTKKS